VGYRERATAVPGAVLWERDVGPAAQRARILPDGCLDVVWDGRRLFVAGPDSTARWHDSRPRDSYVALRFSGGTGPALLGVRADEVRDRTPALAELWPSQDARVLTERTAADPVPALLAWLTRRAESCDLDPFGPRVLAMATVGTPVAVMADRLGLGARQLHRRCLPVFGYGPRRLARVVRLGQAIGQAGAGTPLARVAADCGYVDQAHLSREVRALAGTTPVTLLRDMAG
jgi:AraC-like DNA-binding protein